MSKKEKVIQWLKDKNVFEQFCSNSINRERLVSVFLINKAFIWSISPEGEDFGSKIADDYIEWYKNEFPADTYNEWYKKDVGEGVYVNFHEINLKNLQ